jgi:mRNA-degrading endonuclease toxin of MazEF toxin-antitoxin module
VRRGEVWWYEPPEEVPRPWLILTRDEAIEALDKLLAVPATTIRRIPTEVPLGRGDGMPTECVLSTDNTSPILKSLLIERITTLGPETMAEVCAALVAATSCG